MIRHVLEYLLLVIIIVTGFGGLLYFRFDMAAQIADVVLMAIFYVVWGVLHHYHDKDLSTKVFVEYTAMAALVTFVLIIFLLRA